MFHNKYRYAKNRMAAFVNGELPIRARRRVARYIDENPEIYREYLRQKEAKRELERDLPVFGLPESTRLNTIWARVANELDTDTSVHTTNDVRRRKSWGYSIVALMVALTLILPVVLGPELGHLSVPSQPAPGQVALNKTPVNTATVSATAVAVVVTVTEQSEGTEEYVRLQNTPEAR